MKYEYLSPEGKAQMLTQRLQQLEQEHYNHEINRLNGEALLAAAKKGSDKDAQTQAKAVIAQSLAAQRVIETAHQAAKGELETLDVEVPAAQPADSSVTLAGE